MQGIITHLKEWEVVQNTKNTIKLYLLSNPKKVFRKE